MQGGSNGIGYGLKYQVCSTPILTILLLSFRINPNNSLFYLVFSDKARCIADVKADTDHTSFLTGTLSLKEENEVLLN